MIFTEIRPASAFTTRPATGEPPLSVLSYTHRSTSLIPGQAGVAPRSNSSRSSGTSLSPAQAGLFPRGSGSARVRRHPPERGSTSVQLRAPSREMSPQQVASSWRRHSHRTDIVPSPVSRCMTRQETQNIARLPTSSPLAALVLRPHQPRPPRTATDRYLTCSLPVRAYQYALPAPQRRGRSVPLVRPNASLVRCRPPTPWTPICRGDKGEPPWR